MVVWGLVEVVQDAWRVQDRQGTMPFRAPVLIGWLRNLAIDQKPAHITPVTPKPDVQFRRLHQARAPPTRSLQKSQRTGDQTGAKVVRAADLPEICEALGVDLVTLLARADPEDLRRLGL